MKSYPVSSFKWTIWFRGKNSDFTTATHLIFIIFVFFSHCFPFLTAPLPSTLHPLCYSIRPPPPQTKTLVCASDTEQWEHLLHKGSVPSTSCGLHHLACHFLPGEEVHQQCCFSAERKERHRGHSQTHPGEHTVPCVGFFFLYSVIPRSSLSFRCFCSTPSLAVE